MPSARATILDERSLSAATDFDAALEAFLYGGDREALLRAAAIVIECELPTSCEHADTISNLTGERIEIESYSDGESWPARPCLSRLPIVVAPELEILGAAPAEQPATAIAAAMATNIAFMIMPRVKRRLKRTRCAKRTPIVNGDGGKIRITACSCGSG